MPYHRSMADLYSRFRAAGFDRKYLLRTVLPEHWYDSKANRPAGRAEAEAAFAGAFGLDPESLARPDAPLLIDGSSTLALVNPPDADPARFGPTVALARRLAVLVRRAIARPRPNWLKGMDAGPLREYIIAERRVVRLHSVVQTCYALGVPIVPIAILPKGAVCADAVGVRTPEGPVIVLPYRKLTAPAWLLAHAAHAAGHVAADHLSGGDSLDVNLLGPPPTAEEQAADRFSQILIHGSLELELGGHDRITGVKLAHDARRFSMDHGLDVGSVITRFAFAKAAAGRWARAPAVRALRELGVSDGGPAVLLDCMASMLDLKKLSAPELRFLSNVTGLAARG